jgi:hypothetical protein
MGGIGTIVRLVIDEAVRAALLCNDRSVHLSLFASGAPERPAP